MYRIAIVDQNTAARELTHHMATAFFAERNESVAFMISGDTEELPRNYDCYIMANESKVTIYTTADMVTPWKSLEKPLEESTFFSALSDWQKQTCGDDIGGKENHEA